MEHIFCNNYWTKNNQQIYIFCMFCLWTNIDTVHRQIQWIVRTPLSAYETINPKLINLIKFIVRVSWQLKCKLHVTYICTIIFTQRTKLFLSLFTFFILKIKMLIVNFSVSACLWCIFNLFYLHCILKHHAIIWCW